MKYWIFASFFFLCQCGNNLFDEIANKDTNEAKYFQAKMELNARNYAAAIALLESLDPGFISGDKVSVYASAYSGRCGLEFLTLLNSMQNQGSATFFGLLMGAFPGALVATHVPDCIQAENILQGIGDETVRDGNENLLAAFNGLAKIGTILSSLADADDDGAPDATFEQCDILNDDLPEAMVREIGASMGVIITSLAAIGTDYIDSSVSGITALCAPPSPPELTAICSKTEPADFTALEVRFLRYVIGSSDIGIDSCAGGGNDLSTCAAFYEAPGVPDCF